MVTKNSNKTNRRSVRKKISIPKKFILTRTTINRLTPYRKLKSLIFFNTDNYYNVFTRELYFMPSKKLSLRELNLNKIIKQFSINQATNKLYYLKFHITFLQTLMTYVFDFKGLNYVHNALFTRDDSFLINYKRRNFFPNFSNDKGLVLTTTSSGLFAKPLNKGKAFVRNKMIYLMAASFFRKLFIYTSVTGMTMYIKHQPLYLNELLTTLFKPVVSLYDHPFNNYLVDENLIETRYKFNNIIFLLNKKFTTQKMRQRGRLKRRITKRLIKINNVLD